MIDYPIISSKPIMHIWTIDLDKVSYIVSQYEKILSTDENERARKYIYEDLRLRWTNSTIIKRLLLSHFLDIEPNLIAFDFNNEGKPYLSDAPTIYFNLSHSRSKAVVGIMQGHELGVDIEYNHPDEQLIKIADRYFTNRERDEMLEINTEPYHKTFFRCWTRKEAYIKCKGGGLSIPLDTFAVSATKEISVYRMMDNTTDDIDNWSIESWESDNYTAAATIQLPKEKYVIRHYNTQDFFQLISEN